MILMLEHSPPHLLQLSIALQKMPGVRITSGLKPRCQAGNQDHRTAFILRNAASTIMHILQSIFSVHWAFLLIAVLIGTTGCVPETDGIVSSIDGEGTIGGAPREGSCFSCRPGSLP